MASFTRMEECMDTEKNNILLPGGGYDKLKSYRKSLSVSYLSY